MPWKSCSDFSNCVWHFGFLAVFGTGKGVFNVKA